ncbi:MAG: sigma 54-interacting transcriptional regulator [Candidatus Sulfotelmatobacter sp.]
MFPIGTPYFRVALQRYSILLDVADIVCSRQQPEELFRVLLPLLRTTIPCDLLNYSVPDSRDSIQLHLWNGSEPWPDIGQEITLEGSALGWVWKNQQALVLEDVEQEHRFAEELHRVRTRGVRSYCVLPLTTSHRKVGVLGIGSIQARAFGEPEQRFLLRVSEMVALSLDDTEEQSALIEQKKRIRLLLEVTRSQAPEATQSSLDLRRSISRFLEPLQKWAGQNYVGFYLYDQDTHSLRLYSREAKLGPWLVAGGTASLEGTVAGRVFRNRKFEILNYAELTRLSFASVKRGLELGVKSLCMIPVLRGEEAAGVIKIASRIDHAFSQKDVELLTDVAVIAGASVLASPLESPVSLGTEESEALRKVSNGIVSNYSPAFRRDASDRREPSKLIPFISAQASTDLDQLFNDYFTSSTIGLCILDAEFRYLAINNTLADMNGVPAENHLGKRVADVLGNVAGKIEPKLQHVLASGEPVLNFEITGILPTASVPGHWLETYFPIKDSEGAVKRIGVAVMELGEHTQRDEFVGHLADKLRQEQNRLEVLREIDFALSRHLDFKQLFAAAARCLEKAIPYDLAGIWLYHPEDQTMRTSAIDSRIGDVFGEGQSLPVDECMLGQSMLTGKVGSFSLAELRALPFPSAKRLLQHGINSVCSVPLITPKGPLGALGLACTDNRAFSKDDFVLLSHAASSIALALEIALTRAALRGEKERLQVLSEISSALSRFKTDFQQTFPVISACIRRIVRYDTAAVGVFNRTLGTVSGYALDTSSAQGVFSENVTIPVHQSILGQLLEGREGRNFSRSELEVHARERERLKQALDEGLQSLCVVPLVTPRGVLGAFLLGRKDADPFPAQDLDFLKRLASEVALSLESATAHEALARQQERLQALREIDAALVASADLDVLLPQVSTCLRLAVPHEHISIYLYDEKAQVLRNQFTYMDAKWETLPVRALSIEASVAGRVFKERKARVFDREELATVTHTLGKRAFEQGIRSACLIPLLTAKGSSGVVALASEKENAFGPQDLEFLEQAAAALAQAVQNAAVHKALREEKKRLHVLLNVSSVLTSNWNVQETFTTISSYLRRVLRHECAFFCLYEQENNVFVRQAQDFPLGKGLLAAATPVFRGGPHWLAVAERRPLIFTRDDVQEFRSEAPLADWANGFLEEGLKSMCCVPLLRPKGPLGTLTLASTRAEAFASEDTDLLNQVAAQLAIALENAGISREIDELNSRMAKEKRYLQGETNLDTTFEGIIGDSPALRHVLDQVATVAGSDATALVLGETGTGKELVARAIHRMSRRRDRAFIKLNCAAIPTGLLESELFGHEKGAFTGAVQQKIGRMELADQGTLFLDEVGEIPLELQPKLLRVLQDHEFERLGGVRTIKVNLRLVAATNRQLSKSVASGDFRSDLFYRLNVFPIRMPALRDRSHDIPALVRHFVHKYAGHMERQIESIPTETMNALINHNWPGNVRELENLIERSVILSKGTTLRVPLAELAAESSAGKAGDTLESAEREHIIRVLRETGGVISGPAGAAHKLGLKRTTLQSKMQRLRITRADY